MGLGGACSYLNITWGAQPVKYLAYSSSSQKYGVCQQRRHSQAGPDCRPSSRCRRADGAEIIFDQNNQRIAVSIFPGQDAIKVRLIDLLTCACNPDFDEEHDDIINEALDTILDIGKDELARVAPATPRLVTTSSSKSLHSLLYPETLHYRIDIIDGRRPLFRSILGKPVSLILKRRTSSTWSSIASAPIRDIETLRVFLLAFFFPRQQERVLTNLPRLLPSF